MLFNEAGDGDGSGGAGVPPENTPSFIETIPEGYREKPYMQNIKDMDGLLEQFDNAQGLLGKKALPTEDSTPEEWTEFYNKLGRPEDFNSYEFEDIEMPEGLKRSEEAQAKVKELFHEVGLTPKQAKTLQSKYDQMMIESFKASEESRGAELDKEFDSLADKVFGADKEKALQTAKGLIDRYTPESMQDKVLGLGNNELIVLGSVLNGIQKEFISEDRLNDVTNAGEQGSKEAMLNKARELRKSDAYKDPFHPNHEAVARQVNELYVKSS